MATHKSRTTQTFHDEDEYMDGGEDEESVSLRYPTTTKVNMDFFQKNHKPIIFSLVALSLAIGVIALSLGIVLINQKMNDAKSTKKPKNVVFMIGDGFGPASQTFARVASKKVLALDTILVGTARTYSSDSHVTDSAAGATAYSCAKKSYNGAIAVDPQGKPCGTLMEAAMASGMKTGIVVTTDITDATPAAFSAHAAHRSMRSKIAVQQIVDMAKFNKKNKWGVDVMFGGGKCNFLPNTDTKNSCRKDDRDLIALAKTQYGYTTVDSREELRKLNTLPAIGLFASEAMRYNIDRYPEDQKDPEPTLAEMTKKALDLLSKDEQGKGFFLLVEGSRIDHAGHSNDIAAHLREVQAYNDAVQVVLDFAKQDGDTLVISTADHETGGVTLARCVDDSCLYMFDDEFVSGVTGSTESIARELVAQGRDKVVSIMSSFGVHNLTAQEQDIIYNTKRTKNEGMNLMLGVDEVMNRRAHIGFSTLGHTGVDVNVYVYGAQEKVFHGNQENTDVGSKLAQLMAFDLDKITRELKPSE